MRFKRWIGASVVLLSSSACFHQVVQTGRTPGSTTVDKTFVATWLWGIVPAQPIDVRQQCPNGVAVVTTEQSFLNGLVGGLTLGIYSPQHVQITCASSTASLPTGAQVVTIPTTATPEQRGQMINDAIKHSLDTDIPTVLRF
ncbi:MAG TPA: hypothetical protein VN706_16810 [Gemmatimonadaceae bacterium]|nr:hypothetical protein [Gemmatimonadaceae bacterium]